MGEWSVGRGEGLNGRRKGQIGKEGKGRGEEINSMISNDRGFRGWMAQRLRCLLASLRLYVFEDAKTPRTKDQIIARYRDRTDRRVNYVEPARLFVLCSSHFTTIGGRD